MNELRLNNCFVFLSVFIKQMEVSWKQMPDRRRIGVFLHRFPIVNTVCLFCQRVWTDMLIARLPRSFVSSYRDEELSIPPTRPVEENHQNTFVYCTKQHVTSSGSLHEIPSVWLKISKHANSETSNLWLSQLSNWRNHSVLVSNCVLKPYKLKFV